MPNALHFSPGVDLITDEVAVVMQDRPVVGLSAWLIDAAAAAEAEGRDVQLVTPPRVRITYPARTRLFSGRDARWVVNDGGEAYDGLTGVQLSWDGKKFAPAEGDEVAGAAGLDDGWPRRPGEPAGARPGAVPGVGQHVVGRATELLFTRADRGASRQAGVPRSR